MSEPSGVGDATAASGTVNHYETSASDQAIAVNTEKATFHFNLSDALGRQAPPPFVDRLQRLDAEVPPLAWNSTQAVTKLRRWRQLFVCCEDHNLGMGAVSSLVRELGERSPTVGLLRPGEGGLSMESELRHPQLGGGAGPLIVIAQLPVGGAAGLYDALASEAPAAHATRDELARLRRYVVCLVRRPEWQDSSDRVETLAAIDLFVERECSERPAARERFEELRRRAGDRWGRPSMYERVRTLDTSRADLVEEALRRAEDEGYGKRLDELLADRKGRGPLETTPLWLMTFLGGEGLAERTFTDAMARLLDDVQVPGSRVEVSVYKGRTLHERRTVPELTSASALWGFERASILKKLGLVVGDQEGRRVLRFADGALRSSAEERLRSTPFILDGAFEAATRAGLLFDPDDTFADATARFLADAAAWSGGMVPLSWWADVLAGSNGRPHRRFALLVKHVFERAVLRERVREVMRALVDRHEPEGLAVYLAFDRRADVDFDSPYWFRQILERGSPTEKELALEAMARAMVEPNPRFLKVVVEWYSAQDVKASSSAASAARDLLHSLLWSWIRACLAPLSSGLRSYPDGEALSQPLVLRLLQPDSKELLTRLLKGFEEPATLANAEQLAFVSLAAWFFAPEVLRAIEIGRTRDAKAADALTVGVLTRLPGLLDVNKEHGNQPGNAFVLTALAAWAHLAGDAGDTLLAEVGARQPVEQLGDLASWAGQIAGECERVVDEVAGLPGAGEDLRGAAVRELDVRAALLRRIEDTLGRARAARVATSQLGAVP